MIDIKPSPSHALLFETDNATSRFLLGTNNRRRSYTVFAVQRGRLQNGMSLPEKQGVDE